VAIFAGSLRVSHATYSAEAAIADAKPAIDDKGMK
jgi:hypothetical protein